jgi:hypothetical protein
MCKTFVMTGMPAVRADQINSGVDRNASLSEIVANRIGHAPEAGYPCLYEPAETNRREGGGRNPRLGFLFTRTCRSIAR